MLGFKPFEKEAQKICPYWVNNAAFLTAVIFGMHPIHVEPVAWASDRNGLLYCVFYFASILTYLKYVLSSQNKRLNYMCSFLFFVFSLLSKPMAITLPFVLILLDGWPLNRLRTKTMSIYLEKIPYLIFSLLLSLITVIARFRSGSIASTNFVSVDFRIMNAFNSLIFYFVKLIAPFNLCVLYPVFWRKTYSEGYIFSVGIVILLSIGCYYFRKQRPYLSVAWIFYCLTLFPTIGIISVGSQAAADRYVYLPSFAPLLIFSVVLTRFLEKRRIIYVLLVFGIMCAMYVGTSKQLRTWKDSVSLWENELKIYPTNNASSYSGLGDAYQKVGRFEDALTMFEYSIKTAPDLSYLYNGKGAALFAMGKTEAAIESFKEAISKSSPLDEQNGWAHCHLDIIYSSMGKRDSSLSERKKAMESNPNNAWEHFNQAEIYEKNGNKEEAISQFEESIKICPWFAESYDRLGILYLQRLELEKAVEYFKKAIILEPRNKKYLDHLSSIRTGEV